MYMYMKMFATSFLVHVPVVASEIRKSVNYRTCRYMYTIITREYYVHWNVHYFFSSPTFLSLGNVGPPMPCCEIKLADVEDMNYYAKDNKGEVSQIFI